MRSRYGRRAFRASPIRCVGELIKATGVPEFREVAWRACYLSGEIHSDWREQIQQGIAQLKLDIEVLGPITDHDSSDHVGVEILGAEEHSFWKDHKAAKINALRTQSYISRSDIVVVRFGDKYRQWNATFDAGTANGLGIPVIVMHAPELTHALKEVDAAALAVTESPQQVVEILAYISQK